MARLGSVGRAERNKPPFRERRKEGRNILLTNGESSGGGGGDLRQIDIRKLCSRARSCCDAACVLRCVPSVFGVRRGKEWGVSISSLNGSTTDFHIVRQHEPHLTQLFANSSRYVLRGRYRAKYSDGTFYTKAYPFVQRCLPSPSYKIE